MLIAKALRSRRRTSVDVVRSMQTTSEGGFSESEVSAVIVQPARASPSPQVRMATPETNSRMANRKAALSASPGAALIRVASSLRRRLSRLSISVVLLAAPPCYRKRGAVARCLAPRDCREPVVREAVASRPPRRRVDRHRDARKCGGEFWTRARNRAHREFGDSGGDRLGKVMRGRRGRRRRLAVQKAQHVAP